MFVLSCISLLVYCSGRSVNPNTMALAPLTASNIVDAKLEQIQTRIAFLWSAAHSPLALQTPILAASYMRQLRLLAFHHDVTLSTSHTQMAFCTRCSQVHVPGANATVRVRTSREVQRRQRRASKRRAKEQL